MPSFTAVHPAGVSNERRYITELLASADISVDGHRPWDLIVHDERLFARLLAEGSYMEIGRASCRERV